MYVFSHCYQKFYKDSYFRGLHGLLAPEHRYNMKDVSKLFFSRKAALIFITLKLSYPLLLRLEISIEKFSF